MSFVDIKNVITFQKIFANVTFLDNKIKNSHPEMDGYNVAGHWHRTSTLAYNI